MLEQLCRSAVVCVGARFFLGVIFLSWMGEARRRQLAASADMLQVQRPSVPGRRRDSHTRARYPTTPTRTFMQTNT